MGSGKSWAERCPNWEVEAGYSHDNTTGFDTGTIAGTIPVPLFNRNQGAIRQAEAELTAAQAEVDRVALDLRNRLALTYERYANAHELVDRYERRILPNAKESVELTSDRYCAGESNFPSLLLAQRAFCKRRWPILIPFANSAKPQFFWMDCCCPIAYQAPRSEDLRIKSAPVHHAGNRN